MTASSIWKSLRKKYVLLCCLCGGLCVALGILYLVIYFVLGRYTTSMHYFQTMPLYIPSIVVSIVFPTSNSYWWWYHLREGLRFLKMTLLNAERLPFGTKRILGIGTHAHTNFWFFTFWVSCWAEGRSFANIGIIFSKKANDFIFYCKMLDLVALLVCFHWFSSQ